MHDGPVVAGSDKRRARRETQEEDKIFTSGSGSDDPDSDDPVTPVTPGTTGALFGRSRLQPLDLVSNSNRYINGILAFRKNWSLHM